MVFDDDVDDDDLEADDGPHKYVVTWTDEERLIETREEAVAMARELSQERRVQVDRDDGVESMQFFGGSLETFIFETRDRRKRRRE
ncbi:MAG: hypothetical protein R3F60_12525 [bacterium]